MADHCVSHPVADYFAGFFNDHREFRAHYVSHHLEAKSGRHRALTLRDRLPKSLTKAVGLLLGRVLLSPSLARLAVPLSLAAFVAADSLAISRSRMWLEPPTADPARALARHHRDRRLGASRPPRPAVLVVVDDGASPVLVCGDHLHTSPDPLVAYDETGHFSRADPGHFWRALKARSATLLEQLLDDIRREPILDAPRLERALAYRTALELRALGRTIEVPPLGC